MGYVTSESWMRISIRTTTPLRLRKFTTSPIAPFTSPLRVATFFKTITLAPVATSGSVMKSASCNHCGHVNVQAGIRRNVTSNFGERKQPLEHLLVVSSSVFTVRREYGNTIFRQVQRAFGADPTSVDHGSQTMLRRRLLTDLVQERGVLHISSLSDGVGQAMSGCQ